MTRDSKFTALWSTVSNRLSVFRNSFCYSYIKTYQRDAYVALLSTFRDDNIKSHLSLRIGWFSSRWYCRSTKTSGNDQVNNAGLCFVESNHPLWLSCQQHFRISRLFSTSVELESQNVCMSVCMSVCPRTLGQRRKRNNWSTELKLAHCMYVI